jgi:predicted Zn-dependent peptidase
VLLACLVRTGGAVAGDPNSLAQTLPTDPGVLQTTTPSGLRVIIKPIPTASNISIQLRTPAGTLRETDDERGAADLLHRLIATRFNQVRENAGFRASTSLGAWLSFDTCSYTIEIPEASRDELGRALSFARSILENPPDNAHAFEEARKAARTRSQSLDEPRLNAQRVLLAALDLEANYANRFPQLVDESISDRTLDQTRRFHDSWHSPEGAVLVIVGALGDASSVRMIASDIFRTLPHRPMPPIQRAALPQRAPLRVVHHAEPGLKTADVEYIGLAPPAAPVRSAPSLRESTLDQLATLVLQSRVDQALTGYADEAISAKANAITLSQDYRIHNVIFSGSPDSVVPMLEALGSSLSPAPVTESELEEAFSRVRTETGHKHGARAMLSTRKEAAQLVRASMRHDVLMHADDASHSLENALASIRPSDITDRLDTNFSRSTGWLVMTTPAAPHLPTRDEAREIFLNAAPVIDAPIASGCVGDEHLLCLELDNDPSSVLSIEVEPEKSIFHATLSNGLVIHHQHDSTSTDTVSLSLAIRRASPNSHHPLTLAALTAFRAPHTVTHSHQQIESWMRRHSITMQGRVHADAITLTISTPTEHLESTARLAAALLDEPLLDSRAFAAWQLGEQEARMVQRANAYDAVEPLLQWVGLSLPGPVFEDEQPLEIPFDRQEVQEWLSRLIAQSQIEIAVTGDIAPDEAIDVLSRTLGRLEPPTRMTLVSSSVRLAEDAPIMEPIARTITLPESGTQGVSIIGYRILDDDYERSVIELRVIEQYLGISLASRFVSDPRVSFPPIVYMNRSATSSDIAFLLCLTPSNSDSTPSLHDDIRSFVVDLLQSPISPDALLASKERASQRVRARYQDPTTSASELVLHQIRGLPHTSMQDELDRIERISPRVIEGLLKKLTDPNAIMDITLLSGI